MSSLDVLSDLDAALLQMRGETIDHIDKALARLDAGTYGVCRDCGEEIPVSRLRAIPFAERCRDCQDVAERARTTASKTRNRFEAPVA